MTEYLPPEVAALYVRPQREWTLADWRTLALHLHEARQSALDGWGRATEEANEANRNFREYLDESRRVARSLQEARERELSLLIGRSSQTPQQRRRRGRPRKVTDESNRDLLASFETMKAEFVLAKRHPRPTTRAVLTWYFETSFVKLGVGQHRAHDAGFQRKLKTLINRISDARHPIGRIP